MRLRPRSSACLVLALLALLSLAQLQSGVAILGLFWWSILSWDNKATHDFENNASLTPSFTDPSRHARDHLISGATRPAGRLRAFGGLCRFEPGTWREASG